MILHTPPLARWTSDPSEPGRLPFLLPPALPGHPSVLRGDGGAPPLADVADLAAEIRRRRLFWPASRADAIRAETVIDLAGAGPRAAVGLLDLASIHAGVQARRGAILVVAAGRTARLAARRGLQVAPDLRHMDPAAIRAVYAAFGAPTPCWAALGGARGYWLAPESMIAVNPLPWLARAAAEDPWRRRPIPLAEGLDVLAFLHAEAAHNARPRATVGMSRWKQRNLAPFLAGPCGPARHFRNFAAARRTLGPEGVAVIWGAGSVDAPDPGVERAEDGFIRSVGLGLRHTPPASLVITSEALHFESEGDNGFVRLAREAAITPELRARARRLRMELIRLRMTKYNLSAPANLPFAEGRLRLLVPGQVEGDASLRRGASGISSNAALLASARARHPDAFLLYKPHPDVETGLRPGRVPPEALALADAVAREVSAEACLDWAEKVETMTSLMGFEALLRGKAVATHGRPFYAGWGLTEDLSDHPSRGVLDLDALTAAALILYPRYLHPASRLPAPPEVVIEALAAERAAAGAPAERLRALHRRTVSSLLNRLALLTRDARM